MHPLLANKARLGLYLAAWIPLTAILVYLFGVSGGLGWIDTGVVVPPLCVVYAFVCLSPWYILSRNFRLGGPQVANVLVTPTLAAIVSSLVWVVIAKGFLLGLNAIRPLAGIDRRFSSHLPLLFGVGVLLYLLEVAMHYVLLAFEASREAETREMQARILAREAELRALKLQVNPHFLFNSLNSISALTSLDPAGAREMCIRLSDFLRRTLGLGDRQSISLDEELSLTKNYLDVEEVRFGPRLNVEQEIGEGCRECLVPPLLLQPLVENAVKHGIASLVEGGNIRVAARRLGERLSIRIENGFDPESPPARKNGVGLANVRNRLAARYGDEARMDSVVDGSSYWVELSLPAERR